MRVFLTICLIGQLGVALMLLIGLGWFFFYSGDLPDLKTLAEFSPQAATHVPDPCLKTESIAIPYDSIGENLRTALGAVEARENDPSVLFETLNLVVGKNPDCTQNAPAGELERN